jgi:hypothetical protein
MTQEPVAAGVFHSWLEACQQCTLEAINSVSWTVTRRSTYVGFKRHRKFRNTILPVQDAELEGDFAQVLRRLYGCELRVTCAEWAARDRKRWTTSTTVGHDVRPRSKAKEAGNPLIGCSRGPSTKCENRLVVAGLH